VLISDEKDAVKENLKKTKPGLKATTYENNAKKAVEAKYSMGWKDLYLLGWDGHHIHPVNWGGTDSDSNIQYITRAHHTPFTTWFNARKKEIINKLK
jgi:hypothetical protein